MSVARDLDVIVRGATLIPARIHGREPDLSVVICRLYAAEVGLGALAAVLRLVAGRVALPDLHVDPRSAAHSWSRCSRP